MSNPTPYPSSKQDPNYQRGDIKLAVMDYMRRHPWATNQQVCKALGVRSSYVSLILHRTGVRRDTKTLQVILRFMDRKQLLTWLEDTNPRGVPIADHIMSILNDAMFDDLESKEKAA